MIAPRPASLLYPTFLHPMQAFPSSSKDPSLSPSRTNHSEIHSRAEIGRLTLTTMGQCGPDHQWGDRRNLWHEALGRLQSRVLPGEERFPRPGQRSGLPKHDDLTVGTLCLLRPGLGSFPSECTGCATVLALQPPTSTHMYGTRSFRGFSHDRGSAVPSVRSIEGPRTSNH